MPRRKRRTCLGSVTRATRRMRPSQLGQRRTSIEKQRLSNSAHGRYREPPGLGGWESALVSTSLAGVAGGLGTMRGRSLLAGASTPAYLTVWRRGGGTDAASRQRSDSGSMSTATVPSEKG